MSDERRQISAILEDRGDEKGDDSDAEDGGTSFRVKVPEVEDRFWDNLTIELTLSEAEFLRHQIVACQPASLIGKSSPRENALKQVIKLPQKAGFEQFAELPFISQLHDDELRRCVQHAEISGES